MAPTLCATLYSNPRLKFCPRPKVAAKRLHGDDTTVPLLSRGGTKTARLWTYVREDYPFSGSAPPAVVFKFSRNWAGEHPFGHLKR